MERWKDGKYLLAQIKMAIEALCQHIPYLHETSKKSDFLKEQPVHANYISRTYSWSSGAEEYRKRESISSRVRRRLSKLNSEQFAA
jgi:hypothetical protein